METSQMGQRVSRQVFLTFDVEGPPRNEDLVNAEIAAILHRVLKLLERYRLKGLFFITGTAAAKLKEFSKVLELLRKHEIGYHSSTHSVKPRIFEYTDIEDYQTAVQISKERETSAIDVETGHVIGDGGILLLRRIFRNANITSFRAPFLCWSPPHLEALRDLGFKYDFSANFCAVPASHKGITFYPSPITTDNLKDRVTYGNYSSYNKRVIPKIKPLTAKILREKTAVLLSHPALLRFTATAPSYMYYKNSVGNSKAFKLKSSLKTETSFFVLESLLAELSILKGLGAIEVTPPLEESQNELDSDATDVRSSYSANSRTILRLFGYRPRFLDSHLQVFLD